MQNSRENIDKKGIRQICSKADTWAPGDRVDHSLWEVRIHFPGDVIPETDIEEHRPYANKWIGASRERSMLFKEAVKKRVQSALQMCGFHILCMQSTTNQNIQEGAGKIV